MIVYGFLVNVKQSSNYYKKYSQAKISLTVGWCSPIGTEYIKLLWKH